MAKQTAEYTVVARRYRPQQFADLVGQEAIAKALTNAITTNRVAHAYLFTGVRGVGKTSAARILAKGLNCVKGPTPTPCDKCDICKAVAEGQDVDVQEIDGASNRGIEDARAIRNNVGSRPQRARYKIFIIDEVHMLTREAFNALLKTLEEPPPHVKFIFATTEVQKVPITILSRCQRFDFGGITPNRIFDQLKGIVAREGLKAEDDALRIVVRRAGGSMRDAQSLLEQLLSFDGGTLTAAAVHGILGTASDDRVADIATAILAKDSTAALGLVAKSAEEGLQLGEMVDQLVDYWRGLMLLNCSDGEVGDLNLSEHHRESAKKQARAATLDTILAGLDVLTTAKSRLRTTSHGQVVVEMAVVRLSRLDELVPVAQLAQWLTQPGSAPANGSRPAPATLSDGSKKNGLTPRPEAPRNGSPAPTATKLTEANLSTVWEGVKRSAGMVTAGKLMQAVPAIVGPTALALRWPPDYSEACNWMRDPAKMQSLETLLHQATGESWSLKLEIAAVSAAAAPAAPTKKDRERAAMAMPLLASIQSKLDGRLLKIDEGFGETPATEPVPIDADVPAAEEEP